MPGRVDAVRNADCFIGNEVKFLDRRAAVIFRPVPPIPSVYGEATVNPVFISHWHSVPGRRRPERK